MKKFSRHSFLTLVLLVGFASAFAQMKFVHPGGVDGKAELDFVKLKIAAKARPWYSIYNQMLPTAVASTNTTAPTNNDGAQKADAQKAYANALAWYYTGDVTYANNAIKILNVWGNTFSGYNPVDGQNLLQGGWIGALLGPAAEIMRGYSGWLPSDMAKVQTMFKTAFYPVLNKMSTWNGNVDLTQIDAIMNIAVFCEDETEFNLGVQRLGLRNPAYFYLASDPDSYLNYGGSTSSSWFNPTNWVDGLTQETCRDNGHHSQYAMASALHAAEVAWNQGVDVYTENTERYTTTLELMANQILTGQMGTCSNNTTTSDLYATWEVGFNHYHNRKGIALPKTEQLITTRVRSNGQSDWNIFYETLTHNMDGSGSIITCPKPALGADVSICGQTSLTLNSQVSTTGKTITWYKDNVVISGQTGNTLTITKGGLYKVTVDSSICSLFDEINVLGAIVVDLGGNKELCNPTSYTLDAGNSSVPGVKYTWNNGATTRTVTANKVGTFSVTVSAANCTSGTSSAVVTSKLLKVSADTFCSAGKVNLSVTGTSTYNWFDVATNGVSLSAGNTYSPTISKTSTFYVEESGSIESSMGKTIYGSGALWTIQDADLGATDKIYKVSVLKALTLKSITVYVTSANTSVTINFMQGTTKAYTKTIPNLAVGKQVLALDFNLAVGNYIINAVGTTGSLQFEASGGTFPYSVPGYISFSNNESWQSTWYGPYFDWKVIAGSPCVRTPVYAVIDGTNVRCITGVEDIYEENIGSKAIFTLFPNPTKDRLIVKLQKIKVAEQSEMQITNSMGMVVYKSTLESPTGELILDVSHYSAGVYYVNIGNQIQKFIVQN